MPRLIVVIGEAVDIFVDRGRMWMGSRRAPQNANILKKLGAWDRETANSRQGPRKLDRAARRGMHGLNDT